MATEQSGNRAANYPEPKPYESTTIEENPVKYEVFGGELLTSTGKDGGSPEWESHPAKENQFKTDTLNDPKRSK